MADNVDIGAGNIVATDDVGGRHYQIVKLAWGPDNTVNFAEDASGKRIPITGPVTISAALPAGNNNIGDVDIASLPGSLSGVADAASKTTQPGLPVFAVRSDSQAANVANGQYGSLQTDSLGRLRVATLAADKQTDNLGVYHATDAIMNGLVPLTPKFAILNALAATANQQIVALVASKKIRVLALRLMGAGTAGSATFRSGGASDISETFNFDVRAGIVLGFSPIGHFETAAGQALGVSTSGASATCGIGVVYVEV